MSEQKRSLEELEQRSQEQIQRLRDMNSVLALQIRNLESQRGAEVVKVESISPPQGTPPSAEKKP